MGMSKNNKIIKRYGQYKVDDLFDIHPTKSCKVSGEKGKTPFLSNTALNNGIMKYVKEEPTEKGGMITFSDTTESEKTVFYQERDYIGFSHIQGMYARNKEVWTKNKCLYFMGAFINGIGKGFDYANKFNREKAKNVIVLLPIKDEVQEKEKYVIEDIDFNYMEERVKELEAERVKELEAYLKASGLENYKLSVEDEEMLNRKVKYKNFKLSDIFEIVGTKSIDAGAVKFIEKGINFVGRTDENNGVQGKIEKQKFEPNEAKTITATVIGNYKYVKYQKQPYYCSQNINKLKLKKENIITENIALYLMSSIYKFVSGYNGKQGGYKLDDIKNHIINLPINNNEIKNDLFNNIDFNYMDKYIEVMKKKTIKNVIEYKDKIINLTKEVVK